MNFSISKNLLIQILECVNILYKNELNIEIDSEKWYIQVTNTPIYTTIIDLIIPKEKFIKYEVTQKKNVCINYSNLFKILKKFGDIINIQITEHDINFSSIDIPGNISIGMLSINFDFINLDLSFKNSFSINLKELSDTIQIVDKISHKVIAKFESIQNKLSLISENSYSKDKIIWPIQIQQIETPNEEPFNFILSGDVVNFIKLFNVNAKIKFNEAYVFQIEPQILDFTVKGIFSLVDII